MIMILTNDYVEKQRNSMYFCLPFKLIGKFDHLGSMLSRVSGSTINMYRGGCQNLSSMDTPWRWMVYTRSDVTFLLSLPLTFRTSHFSSIKSSQNDITKKDLANGVCWIANIVYEVPEKVSKYFTTIWHGSQIQAFVSLENHLPEMSRLRAYYLISIKLIPQKQVFEFRGMSSSVASPICQEGQSERTFPIFAFSSWFFLIFPLFFPNF